MSGNPSVVMIGAVGCGGHARYCVTLTAALCQTGVRARLIGPQFATPAYTRVRALRYADRSIRHGAFVARALREISATRPDIVHLQSTLPIMDQIWVPRLSRRRKVVITVHNVEPHVQSLATHRNFEKRLLSAAAALILHSEETRREFVRRHPDLENRTFVVRHGVWPPSPAIARVEARERLKLPSGRKVVLFFGALRRNKGLGLLLEALAIVKQQRPVDVPLLVVAGKLPSNESFARYQQAIGRLGLVRDVDIRLGFIEDDLVSSFYAAADVIALPYEESFKAQSGVLLETYGHGRPVVVTRAGALGETVAEDGTGWIAETRTPEAFARALSEALWNEAQSTLVAERMEHLRRVKYHWSAVGIATRSVYETVLRLRDADQGEAHRV